MPPELNDNIEFQLNIKYMYKDNKKKENLMVTELWEKLKKKIKKLAIEQTKRIKNEEKMENLYNLMKKPLNNNEIKKYNETKKSLRKQQKKPIGYLLRGKNRLYRERKLQPATSAERQKEGGKP